MLIGKWASERNRKKFKSGLLDSTCIFEIFKDDGGVRIGEFVSPMPKFWMWAVTYCDKVGGVIKLNNRMSYKSRGNFCCCCSVTKSCPTLCNPMDCSTPGSPVLQYLPEFPQIHVHWVGDAIWPSHPLPPPLLLPSIFPSIRVFYSELALRIR